MKKYLLILLTLLMFLTGCSNNGNFNANLAAFKKENVNIDESDLIIGPITISKNNDCYIVIVNIALDNDQIFESVLINNTLTSIHEDYKVSVSFGNDNVTVFDSNSIWKTFTLQKYIVNHTLTFVINEGDVPVDVVRDFDRVISSQQKLSPIELSFFGINDELFYSLYTYVGLAE